MTHGGVVHGLDINYSGYLFEPNLESNEIYFGMKGIPGLNGDTISQIINCRPFSSFDDFLEGTSVSKTAIISLIKAGAFDSFGDRVSIMTEYLSHTCNMKQKITMQNVNGLIENNLIPDSFNKQIRAFEFAKAMKKNNKCALGFSLDNDSLSEFSSIYGTDIVRYQDGIAYVTEKEFKKTYDSVMSVLKKWIVENQDDVLSSYNNALLSTEFEKYAAGSVSHWEMESLGFYIHDHELKDVNDKLYGISCFSQLSVDVSPNKWYNYELKKIIGTVIAKDDVHHTVSLLTKDSGVVAVKFKQEDYAWYNKRISIQDYDGTKSVIDDSWFAKGALLLINGYRRQDMFVAKARTVLKIISINKRAGTFYTIGDRYGGDVDEQ